MPKLKRTFTSGRMNKDLDERLVPNGEYTDALNIQVGHSEGSDVGAIENILGNTAQSALGLTNATVIGSIRHNSTNCIYWFITATGVDCIAEYNQTTDTVSPVIVDKNSVLNFSTDYLITGINIIDNLLFWTDNNSEPKKINIDTFKDGSTDFDTHTHVYGSTRDFILADVKVIKRGPTTAPVIGARSTRKTGTEVGCGINKIDIVKNFTNAHVGTGFYNVLEVGDTVTLGTAGSVVPNWAVDDIIVMDATSVNDSNYEDDYRVRVKLTAVTTTTVLPVTGEILSISPNITNNSFTWKCVFEEEEPMFELSFPRFAYRWKYADGEYSTFSPFSDPAFVPDSFGYSSADAYNDGMVNNLRKLTLSAFETAPAEVEEVDVLYKDSNSNLVYKVETLDAPLTTYSVESELITNVLDSIQLLRQWDNVPLKAKAQEITANRVLYGNYLQGYNMLSGSTAIRPQITTTTAATAHSDVGEPLKSVKTMRSYQVGVVYGDADGRESPVFTSDAATVSVDKKNAKSTNAITAQITSAKPSWATYFKYFVKDISNEYYNLALDRFYKADDGNVWLSFPSAERSKITENTYLNIKKEHDSSLSVDGKAKYRVLDIQASAPADIVFSKEFYASFNTTIGPAPSPRQGIQTFAFYGPLVGLDPKFFEALESGTVIRFWTDQNESELYNVLEGGPTGTVSGGLMEYNVKLDREITVSDDWVNSLSSNDRLFVGVYKTVEKHKKEYAGKFFVKIHRDAAFDEAILDPLVKRDINYVAGYVGDVDSIINDDPNDTITEPGNFSFAEHTNGLTQVLNKPPTNNDDTFIIGFAPHRIGIEGSSPVEPTGRGWFDTGLVSGNFISFEGDPANNYYEIETVTAETDYRDGSSNNADDNKITYKTVELKTAVVGTFTATQIKIYNKKTTFGSLFTEDNIILSSPNPAIFETEPDEALDIDIFYSASNAISGSLHGASHNLTWFNCYSFGNGVESDRIRDDFNAPRLGKGVKVSAPIDEPYAQERRATGLIFSGIYNSISGVNKLNQFTLAEDITKNLNPTYGSIQKLHTRDTNVIVLCEDKVLRILTHKDALYNADGNVNITSNFAVLGQSTPFVGEFGISKNPESFASYGFRAYFSDKSRGVVLRLSRDGLTEISSAGMSDFFVDNLRSDSTVIGSFDDQTNCYNITLNGKTASFKEDVRGWPTLKSFIPESGLSLNNTYYTFKNGELYSHDNASRNTFYGAAVEESSVTFLFNDAPSSVKNYQAISYEGDSGWTMPSIETNKQSGRVMSFVEKEGMWYNYIKGLDTTWNNLSSTGSLDTSEFSVQGIGTVGTVTVNTGSLSMEMGVDINVSLQANAGDVIYFKDTDTGKTIKVGQCTAIVGSVITCARTAGQPTPHGGEQADFIFFAKNSEVNTSGLIGYYAEVKAEVTSSSAKELFAVNAEIVSSS